MQPPPRVPPLFHALTGVCKFHALKRQAATETGVQILSLTCKILIASTGYKEVLILILTLVEAAAFALCQESGLE